MSTPATPDTISIYSRPVFEGYQFRLNVRPIARTWFTFGEATEELVRLTGMSYVAARGLVHLAQTDGSYTWRRVQAPPTCETCGRNDGVHFARCYDDTPMGRCPEDGDQPILRETATKGPDPYAIEHLACGHRVVAFGPDDDDLVIL